LLSFLRETGGKTANKKPPYRGLPLIYYLPKAQDLPPCRANCQVDQRRNGRHDEAVLPPFTLRDIASAKVDRGTAVAVMREGDRHIGEDAEDDEPETCGCSCCDGHHHHHHEEDDDDDDMPMHNLTLYSGTNILNTAFKYQGMSNSLLSIFKAVED